jgi:hypothetical protein
MQRATVLLTTASDVLAVRGVVVRSVSSRRRVWQAAVQADAQRREHERRRRALDRAVRSRLLLGGVRRQLTCVQLQELPPLTGAAPVAAGEPDIPRPERLERALPVPAALQQPQQQDERRKRAAPLRLRDKHARSDLCAPWVIRLEWLAGC